MPNLQRVEEINRQIAASPLGYLGISQAPSALEKPPIKPVSTTGETKSPVSIISTTQAIPKLNEANVAQDADNARFADIKKRNEEQKKNWFDSVRKSGGMTGEEVVAVGGSINNYDFDSNSGLYIPNYNRMSSGSSSLDQAKEDLKEIERTFGEAESIFIDTPTNALIESIRNQYTNLINETRDFNTRSEAAVQTAGIRSGTARYAPEIAKGIVSAEARAGVARIADLTGKIMGAIATAEQARAEKKYDLFVKKRAEITELKKKQIEEFTKQQTEAKKRKEEMRKQKIQVSRDNAVAGLLAQGVTDPIQLINYLNYDEEGNETGDFTAEEINKTLTNLTGKNGVDLGTDGNMFKFALQQGWLPEGSTIFDYWKNEAASKKSPSSEKAGMGADVGFNQFAKESIAFSVLPPTLRNSDTEKAYYLQGIRSGLSQGKTPYEIADVLMGYNITEPSAFSEGLRRYISIAGTDKNVAPEIARLVNAKQYDKAIAVVENAVYDKAKKNLGEKFISESEVEFLVNKSNEIQKTLDDYGFFDAIGPFAGTFNDAMGKLGRKKGAELKAKITYLTQEIQKRQAGSAMTESEWARILEPIVPQLTDKRGIFEMKIKEGKNTPLQKLNAERSQYELPTINEAELLNRKLRIPAYSSQVAFDPLDVGSGGTVSSDNPLGI